jgi:hypothetical protein
LGVPVSLASTSLASKHLPPKFALWPRLLATVCCFAALEGLIFHTGLYASIIEPVSTAGGLELRIRAEIERPKPDRNQVLAVGHSRQALWPKFANEMQPSTGYTFASIGLGGTSPRTWYYSLRAVDPGAHTYAAILIPEDDYNEPDTGPDPAEQDVDLHYLIARLGLRDLIEFPESYHSTARKWGAFESILLKGLVYKTDFQQFLEHPWNRVEKAQFYAQGSAGWAYDYGGDARTLAGLEIDWAHKILRFPPGVAEADQRDAAQELFPDLPSDEGHETAYLRYWYGRILDYYRGSGTKIFFVRVPRAPTSPPEEPVKLHTAVRDLIGQPNVIVMDEHLLDPVEHPENFWDGWHLNRKGMQEFTRIVVAEICKALGPPPAE